MDYVLEIERSKNIADIFEIVKKIVRDYTGNDQAGLLVGLTDLGISNRGFIGAFYSLNANMIVINKRPLNRILQTNPAIYKYYLFHVILHEYIHSIGYYDENDARQIVIDISRNYFGDDHIISEFAQDIKKFLPNLTYPNTEIQPKEIYIDFIRGIDRKNTNYIG